MAKKFEVDAFVASALHHVEAGIRSSWQYLQRGDSPIEKMLFASLILRVKYGNEIVTNVTLVPADRETTVKNEDWLVVRPQYTVIDWPVDFLMEVTGAGGQVKARLAVECDGHEFHERSKEQASRDRSRDRALQAAKVTVFRFTGSEIYRDPWKCSSQILEWAENVVVGLNV